MKDSSLNFLKRTFSLIFLNININKRQKIIVATLFITAGLLSIGMINFIYLSYKFIVALGVVAYILCLWALWEGMDRQKAIILLILPTLFTIAVASFYFLLPNRWLTRLPVSIVFFISFYSLLLSQNVFSIASIRTIPLYRAASTVSFLFTLITAFFLFNVVSGFDLSFFANGLLVAAITFPLVLQILWTVEMEKVTLPILVYSLIISLIVGESATALSFWPVAPTIWSIFLATLIYVMVAQTTEYMKDRLTKRVMFEYIVVGALVMVFSYLVTSWGG